MQLQENFLVDELLQLYTGRRTHFFEHLAAMTYDDSILRLAINLYGGRYTVHVGFFPVFVDSYLNTVWNFLAVIEEYLFAYYF